MRINPSTMNQYANENFNLDWYRLGLFEYMLIANPDEQVHQKMMVEKEAFYHQYGTEIAVKTWPHITVAKFFIKKEMEDWLCKGIQNACSLQCCFSVDLNNYSGFPAHTVFVRVQNPTPFRQLIQSLKKLEPFIESSSCPPSIYIDKPYISIARQLDEETYQKAIVEYSKRSFREVFQQDSLTLLKRDGPHSKWQHVTHMHLPIDRNLFN